MARREYKSFDHVSGGQFGDVAVPHPREGVTFREMPAETQAAAHTHMDRLHREAVPQMRRSLKEDIKGIKQDPRGMTPARQTRMENLEGALSDLSGHPKSAMEAGINRVTETAMAPVEAVRAHRRATGEMLPVAAGEFYGARHDIGRRMTEHYFPGDRESQVRAELATPEWSARTTPQQEVGGASGMLAMLKHGEHVNVSVGPQLADLFNTPEREGGWKGGHGGEGAMQPGNYNFTELARNHPQAAMIMMQHHVKETGLVVPAKSVYTPERLAVTQARQNVIRSSGRVDLPEELHTAAAAMISGLGQTGFPKGARSMTRFFSDPTEFGGHQFHKIPSYTHNIHTHDPVMAAGTHHFLGVLAHGNDWLKEHPEGVEALKAAKAHPAWNDPTSTMDVWSGRVASGIPFHAVGYMGKEATNPEEIMKGAALPRRTGGQRYGSPQDMGYFWGEEAHRQAASNITINPRGTGIGRMSLPPHVGQSLSWYGVQAEENAHQIRQGNRTMAPRSMRDPRSLNSLQFPEVY